MQISEHFTLEELTKSSTAARLNLDNTAPPLVKENLERFCREILEPVRLLFNSEIIVNSAYRSPDVNRAVGSNIKSQHLFGCAADILVKGRTPREVCEGIIASGIEYDQIILEFDAWTHISCPTIKGTKPRKQALIINHQGIKPFS
jgi:hypothetical protein